MITWFDALLITLWALLTALGARRGLSGLAWGLSGIALCFLANSLSGSPLAAALIALMLSAGMAVAISRLIPAPLEQPWHMAPGALGGFLLGGLLVCTAALSFPLDVQVTTRGPQGTYPSPSLPPAIYDAVRNSAVKNALRGVWGSGVAVKTLLIPDQVRGF
ncbi:hypothetical protein HNQ07_001579 [Deinococcus metalli]|uniref:Colicin V production protein n=1 Tax=Deinococcus metalli TaxID=1141878 RepID=A0A7W8KDD7_9DEIO|nr:hypothetical protein [Deinococcus metalli]MBB5376122.1 hypothetical protein [Deinococcus metalli]GHF40638.1 hypothetical protein GCM10017781_16610 [Deinococcus metalli]